MKLSKIALVLGSVLTLGLAAPAMAAEPRSYEWHGHYGSVTDNGSWNWDYISLSGPAGNTQLKVMCTGNGGNEWTSFGTFSQAANQAVADSWCSEF